MNIRTSRWKATLVGRDTEFEARVNQVMAMPVPIPLSAAARMQIVAAIQALRDPDATGYRACLLAQLERKNEEVLLAAWKTQTEELVGAAQTCEDLASAILPMMEMQRQFQLRGTSCPMVDDWREIVAPYVKRVVQATLSRPHSREEVACMARAQAMNLLDLGDLGVALEQELQRLYPPPADPR